uniref:Uncharacterized protein n=1 Tax=Cacopsylla melanoneura TaxID=428564 RepID=A0A8D8Q7D3_9HEMI
MAEGSGGKPPDIPPVNGSMNKSPDSNARQPVLYSSDHKFSWYKLIIQAKPKYCSTKSTLCKKCFSIELDNHVCDLVNLKCLNCHGPHNVNSKNCPEFERQKTIKIMMSTRNMCFPEAADLIPSSKQSYSVQTRNSFHVLDPDGADQGTDFPELRNKNPCPRREFAKYVPPPLSTKTSTFKRKTVLSFAAPGSDRGSKKNKTEPQLFKDMKNLTRQEQYHKDKEIASMFYNNAKNNKLDFASTTNLSQGTQSCSGSPSVVHQTTVLNNIDNANLIDPTFDVLMSENTNSDGYKGPPELGDFPNVRSPDLR